MFPFRLSKYLFLLVKFPFQLSIYIREYCETHKKFCLNNIVLIILFYIIETKLGEFSSDTYRKYNLPKNSCLSVSRVISKFYRICFWRPFCLLIFELKNKLPYSYKILYWRLNKIKVSQSKISIIWKFVRF